MYICKGISLSGKLKPHWLGFDLHWTPSKYEAMYVYLGVLGRFLLRDTATDTIRYVMTFIHN